jgi:SAM-dependent methyltransferase
MDQNDERDWFADGDAYEHYIGRWSRPVGHLFLDWLSRPDGLRWVDVGCGTGALSATVLERANPEAVTGIEPSDGFRAVARRTIVDDRAEFMPGDAQGLPLADAGADVAVSGLVLNFVPDKELAVREMRRIVEPGGTVAVYVWDYAGEMQLIRYFWDAVGELFADAAARDEGRQFPICKPEPLADLFRAAGLRDVETRALDAPTVFADFDDFWSPFLAGQGPAGAQCVALSEDDRERLRERLEDSLPIGSDGTISLIARAWAVRGTA